MAIAVYAVQIEPDWVRILPVTLELPHLDPEFQGYRIVQISDIHLAERWEGGMPVQRLQRFVAAVNRQQPDLVALTGDFFTRAPSPFTTDLVQALSQLTPRDRAVAVLGNHDYWREPNSVRQALQEAGIPELRNDVYTLQRGKAQLHIAGVDDVWVKQAQLDRVLERLPAEGAAILLAHEPDFVDITAATGRFDLQLSGHSHGGQVRLPGLEARYLPPYGRKYPLGRYQVQNTIQYTNVGLGTTQLPIRFFCRPEIAVFTLKTA
jgi:predicted MPP superfamily phosphohydrolase